MKINYGYPILFLAVAMLVSCAAMPVQAGSPDIKISLKFEKEKIEFDEPVMISLSVKNSGKPLKVSKGFKDMNYFMQMRVINPAKRLLLPRNYNPNIETPDAPPLPYIRFKGKSIRVVECEELPHNWVNKSQTIDLRDYYDLSMPGKYEVQVQLSVMIFEGGDKESPCDINKPRWQGVLKSKPKSFIYILKPLIKKQLDEKKLHKSDSVSRLLETKNKSGSELDNDRKILASLNTVGISNSNSHMRLRSDMLNKRYEEPGYRFVSRQPLVKTTPNPVVSKASTQTPSANMITPAHSSDVDPNTVIAIEMSKAGKKIVVMMHVMGLEVYNSLSPAQHQQYTDIIGRPPSYTLIYRHWDDPRLNIESCQQVNVTVAAFHKNTPEDEYNFIFNFRTAASLIIDEDGDCIPNDIETNLLGTGWEHKTLFVLPLKEVAPDTYEFWPEFKSKLFPFPAHMTDRPGIAYIEKLYTHPDVPIEISIIGDPQHPYIPMRKQQCPTNPPDISDPDYPLNCFYDPANDAHPAGPPCDILVVYYMEVSASCPANVNKGHTFFNGATWSWDTKGITDNMLATDHYRKYQYHIAYVYGVPLDNYFTQGAYEIIESNQSSIPLPSDGIRLFCDSVLCAGKCSSMNLNDNENAPPYHLNPDSKVEFNPITFYGDGKVSSAGNRQPGFDRNEVLRRTTLHEMGHALLSAQNSDHCANNKCIMSGWVEDWTLHGFGDAGSCTHSAEGSKDIRGAGVIHNSVH